MAIPISVPQPSGQLSDIRCEHVHCMNFITLERVRFKAKTCGQICTKRAKASRQYKNRKLGIDNKITKLRNRIVGLEKERAKCTCGAYEVEANI